MPIISVNSTSDVLILQELNYREQMHGLKDYGENSELFGKIVLL